MDYFKALWLREMCEQIALASGYVPDEQEELYYTLKRGIVV